MYIIQSHWRLSFYPMIPLCYHVKLKLDYAYLKPEVCLYLRRLQTMKFQSCRFRNDVIRIIIYNLLPSTIKCIYKSNLVVVVVVVVIFFNVTFVVVVALNFVIFVVVLVLDVVLLFLILFLFLSLSLMLLLFLFQFQIIKPPREDKRKNRVFFTKNLFLKSQYYSVVKLK